MPNGTTSPRIFVKKDAPSGALDSERIGIIGYGHLGRPFAMNLRDSGIRNLVIGNIADDYAEQATADGFAVVTPADAVRQSDILLLLLPDEVVADVFRDVIGPNLKPGSAIVFASGYTIAFNLITAPDTVDLLLLAPRMAGENARQRFMNKQGFYGYVSVENDASGKAWTRLLGLADAVGMLNAGALELDAKKEALIDLFIEQSVGAVLGAAVMTAFSAGVEAGIPAEAMVMEMYMSEEMEQVWRAFREQGFLKSSNDHGPTAMFGGYLRTMEFIERGLGQSFTEILHELQTGSFASKFESEREAGYPILTMATGMITDENPIAQAESRVRELLAIR